MAWDIRLKLGVSPLIIIPIAIKASYLFIYLAIVTGISNAPSQPNVSYRTLFLSNSWQADLTNERGALYLENTTKILVFFFILLFLVF